MNLLREWLRRGLRLLPFLCLSAVFFLTYHDPSRVQTETYNQAKSDLVADVETGSPVRQVSWLLLGAWAAWSLLYHRRNRPLHFLGVLGPVLLGFAVWAFLSCLWADDLVLTGKRLVSFGLLCLLTVAIVRRFSLREIVVGTVLCTGEYLLFEIAAEIVHGTFSPWASGYRFGGLQHPNSEGIELAPLVLAGLAAAHGSGSRRMRQLFYAAAAVGFAFLLLTGSRTALLAMLLGLLVYLLAGSTPRRRATILAGASALVFAVLALAGSGGLTEIQNALLLGREDVASQDLTSFTGRTVIWEDVSPYIWQSPVLGHGYNGFWTTDHIADISDREKWGVPNSHSTYVDYMLTLGLVGVSLYSFAMLAGMLRAGRLCAGRPDPNLAWVCGLLLFSVVDGLMESAMGEGELGTLLCAVALVWLGSVEPQQIWRGRAEAECAA